MRLIHHLQTFPTGTDFAMSANVSDRSPSTAAKGSMAAPETMEGGLGHLGIGPLDARKRYHLTAVKRMADASKVRASASCAETGKLIHRADTKGYCSPLSGRASAHYSCFSATLEWI